MEHKPLAFGFVLSCHSHTSPYALERKGILTKDEVLKELEVIAAATKGKKEVN